MYKKTAIDHFGTNILLAQVLKLTPGATSQWGKIIPEKQALKLEKLTNGHLRYDQKLYE